MVCLVPVHPRYVMEGNDLALQRSKIYYQEASRGGRNQLTSIKFWNKYIFGFEDTTNLFFFFF